MQLREKTTGSRLLGAVIIDRQGMQRGDLGVACVTKGFADNFLGRGSGNKAKKENIGIDRVKAAEVPRISNALRGTPFGSDIKPKGRGPREEDVEWVSGLSGETTA
jgi:hypothetical protein